MTVPYTGEARQPDILAACIIFSILSPLAVGLRFYARRLSGAGIWWDDWTVLIALPIALGFNVLMLWGLSVGFGANPAPERAHYLPAFFKALYSSEIIYNTSLPFVKVSILLFYRRIFPNQWMIRGVWVLGILNVLWFLGTEPTIIFQCTPISKVWDDTLPGVCFNLRDFLLAQAISSIIIDILTLCLPVRAVMSLHMPLRRKLMVSSVFLVGIFAVTCSIIRLPYILSTLRDNTPYTDLYVFEPGNVWSLAELHVALICACLPTIYPIFRGRYNSKNKPKIPTYQYNRAGYRRTWSNYGVSRRIHAAMGADHMDTRDHSDIDTIDRHSTANITSVVGSNDVELAHLSPTDRSEKTRITGPDEISMQTEVEVFTSTK